MQEMSLLLKLSEAQDMQFWFVVAFALGAPVLRKSCRPTSSIWRQGEINRDMCLLFLVHRFAILLDLTEVLNIKNITLKWSLWDAEVAKKNKDILKSDGILLCSFCTSNGSTKFKGKQIYFISKFTSHSWSYFLFVC